MFWFFVFFFVSGFCGILYELVWLRLAMAQFGVTTALVSIVLSMFMAGLGGGSWAAGKLVRQYDKKITVAPLRLYALAELLIGCSALAVPVQLLWGHALLEWASKQATMGSASYYLISGTWLALTLVPWCACMGATIPLAMFAIKRDPRNEARRSFSFLYLANVLGGVAGAIICLALIELYGFHGTLRVGAFLNATICVTAFCLTLASKGAVEATPSRSAETPSALPPSRARRSTAGGAADTIARANSPGSVWRCWDCCLCLPRILVYRCTLYSASSSA